MHDMEKQKKEEGDEEEDKADQPGIHTTALFIMLNIIFQKCW